MDENMSGDILEDVRTGRVKIDSERFNSHLHDVLRQDLLGDWNFEVAIESDDDYDYITISVPKNEAQKCDSTVTEITFEFLDDLRESGTTNMYGAVPHLMAEFGFDKATAKDMLKNWMSYKRGDKK